MRGKLEQKPVIIDLDSNGEPLPFETCQDAVPITPPSSDDSYSGSESETLPDTPEPEKSKETPVDHSTQEPPKVPPMANGHSSQKNYERFNTRPRLDTGFYQYGSLPAQLPRFERAPSPYVSSTHQTRRQDTRNYSAEQLLSPKSLKANDHGDGPRSRSQRPQDPIYHSQGSRGSGSGSGSDKDRRSYESNRQAQSTLDRRTSAMPILGSPTSPKHPIQFHHKDIRHSSSDESESEYPRYKVKPAEPSAEPKSKVANSYFDNERQGENRKPNERPRSSKHPSSPPRTPAAAERPKWGQPLNREGLLNSAALLGSGAVLDSHHRKASPRPSPQISPNQSPYPSPPRTPPESHQNPANPMSNPKYDSHKANSRPSSPLSSVPSSPKPVEFSHMSYHGEREARPARPSQQSEKDMRLARPSHQSEQDLRPARPSQHNEQDMRPPQYMPRARATSPLPLTRRSEAELPIIDVRSPSPLPVGPAIPTKPSSQEKNEMRTPSRYVPDYASGSTLMPTRPERRQRSLSNVDARGSRPANLTINPVAPPVIHQADIEYLSPTSENTPSHFHSSPQHMGRPPLLSPTAVDGRSKTSSLAEPTPSTRRSRSLVPTPNAPAPRANSAAPPPTSGHRSRSPAPAPKVALSDQPAPGPLPRCPRPDPVSGFNDWYTLEGCIYFAICPDCRHNIFGLGYERFFKPRSSRPHGKKTQCQMNDPWVRMACIASISSKHPDVNLLTKLANVSEDYEACPGPKPAEHDWYHVEDENADEDDHLADFQVCTHCVHSVEALLPPLKGTFFRYKGHQVDSTPRPCSLRFDNARFGQYIDKCDRAAQEAIRTRKEPDMSDFVWYHKKETVIGECTRDQVLIGRDWHLNALIPEFAVCEMCYYDTVRPLISKNYNLAKTVSPTAKHISDDVSCQLYSPRMKEIFERACREDDEDYLRQAVLTRRKLQVEILAARMEVQQKPSEWKAQKELDELMENWRKLEKKRH